MNNMNLKQQKKETIKRIVYMLSYIVDPTIDGASQEKLCKHFAKAIWEEEIEPTIKALE